MVNDVAGRKSGGHDRVVGVLGNESGGSIGVDDLGVISAAGSKVAPELANFRWVQGKQGVR